MRRFEVKGYIEVEAEDEARALLRAAEILDELPSGLRAVTALEGMEGVYELEDEEDEEPSLHALIFRARAEVVGG